MNKKNVEKKNKNLIKHKKKKQNKEFEMERDTPKSKKIHRNSRLGGSDARKKWNVWRGQTTESGIVHRRKLTL